MKNLLKALTRPLAGRSYCQTCAAWYDPSDPRGDWHHVNCP